LAVTWYSTSIDEADVGMNLNFDWSTQEEPGSGFDLETVLLHEFGHVVGLGHSLVTGAVMEATYVTSRQELHVDDMRGITHLYPDAIADSATFTGKVKDSKTSEGIDGATVSIAGYPQFGTATTDESGAYTLEGVPLIGYYDLTAAAKD